VKYKKKYDPFWVSELGHKNIAVRDKTLGTVALRALETRIQASIHKRDWHFEIDFLADY
jgi:hypothetical protein